MSHLENGIYQEAEAIRRNDSINGSNLSDEISVKVRWLQDNLVEGPQYGPASVKVFREDIRTNLIEKFGGPVSDLEIGVVLRRAFPHHVRRGKFFCGIGRQTKITTKSTDGSIVEVKVETKENTNSVKEMSDSAAVAREVQVPMKKRMTIRERLHGDEDRERKDRRMERVEERHQEIIQKSIPEQPIYKSSFSHPVSQISPSPQFVVTPSPVLHTYAPQPYSQGVVVPTQAPLHHHFSLQPTSDQRTMSSLEAQQRYHHFNPYGVPRVPQELLSPFAMVGRAPKRHDHGPPVMNDHHSSPHKKAKKPKRPKEGGRLDIPQSPGKGMQGSMPLGQSAVQPILLNFDVPLPKVAKVKSLNERLPDEIKYGRMSGDGSAPNSGGSVALQDHQVTSEQGQDVRQPDSQGLLEAPTSSQRFTGHHSQDKPPPFIPKRAEEVSPSSEQPRSKGPGEDEDASPFKVPSIDRYKASTASSGGQQPVLTCFICKNQLHPGSPDYPSRPSLIVTCLRCKKVAFGKKESGPAPIPKFPAACNPRVAPSEEVSALRRRTFWKCLINHHKSTKQLRRRGGRIPRVVVNNRTRSVSSSVTGSYPPSPQPMSPMSTCTAPSPCTSLPPSPRSECGMSVPGSPLSQLPSPSHSPLPQEGKRNRSLHPPSLIPDGPQLGGGGSRPVNSPKISSSGNDMRRISVADPSSEDSKLEVPSKNAVRRLSPGATSDVTMSPDSISLPPGRENEDATVRALLSLSSSSSGESSNKGKLEVPSAADITGRRHSSPSIISAERRYALREYSSRLAADSTESNGSSVSHRPVIQDCLDHQDLKYLSRGDRGGHPPRRTFMISGQFVGGGSGGSGRPYEAFCCSCTKEDLVFIRCPDPGCEFVCNSISSMQAHEEGHLSSEERRERRRYPPPGSPQPREGVYDDGESRSSVETQSADTDVEARSPSSVSHFQTHSKQDAPSPPEDDHPPAQAPAVLSSTSSSVIDLGTTGHHVSISRPSPSSLAPTSGGSREPTSPLDLSGKRQYLGAPIPGMGREKPPSPFPMVGGAPLDLSSQTKHGYSDIVSYQAHNREKEQFVSNPMLGSTGKVIERPSAPATNMMPSIQIPLPTVSLSAPMTAQLPTLVNPGSLPFFYTPFIPYQPAGPGGAITSGMPHPILMGAPSSRQEKHPSNEQEQPKIYQGPFSFLNQVHAAAAARSRAMAGKPMASNGPHMGETLSPTSSSSSGSWHRERLRETSPASRPMSPPQRAPAPGLYTSSPQSVSYQGGTISIQTSPTSLGGFRRISPKTVKIESPFHQSGGASPLGPSGALSPPERGGPSPHQKIGSPGPLYHRGAASSYQRSAPSPHQPSGAVSPNQRSAQIQNQRGPVSPYQQAAPSPNPVGSPSPHYRGAGSPYQQASLSPNLRDAAGHNHNQRGMASPSSTGCPVQVKVEECSDEDVDRSKEGLDTRPGSGGENLIVQDKTLQT